MRQEDIAPVAAAISHQDFPSRRRPTTFSLSWGLLRPPERHSADFSFPVQARSVMQGVFREPQNLCSRFVALACGEIAFRFLPDLCRMYGVHLLTIPCFLNRQRRQRDASEFAKVIKACKRHFLCTRMVHNELSLIEHQLFVRHCRSNLGAGVIRQIPPQRLKSTTPD